MTGRRVTEQQKPRVSAVPARETVAYNPTSLDSAERVLGTDLIARFPSLPIGPAGDLDLAYQPIYDVVTGDVVAAEALIRWNHPTAGLIPNDTWIDAAAAAGATADIALWVLDRIRQDSHLPELAGLQWNVNMTPVDVTRQRVLRAAITAAGDMPDGSSLTIELTETTAPEDHDELVRCARLLAEHGIGIALDDFGSGWATLPYLEHIPATSLKFDRDFIGGVGVRDTTSAIALSVVNLVTSAPFGMTVVGEGIETQRHLDAMKYLGVNRAQGYLLARPGPIEQLAEARLRGMGDVLAS